MPISRALFPSFSFSFVRLLVSFLCIIAFGLVGAVTFLCYFYIKSNKITRIIAKQNHSDAHQTQFSQRHTRSAFNKWKLSMSRQSTNHTKKFTLSGLFTFCFFLAVDASSIKNTGRQFLNSSFNSFSFLCIFLSLVGALKWNDVITIYDSMCSRVCERRTDTSSLVQKLYLHQNITKFLARIISSLCISSCIQFVIVWSYRSGQEQKSLALSLSFCSWRSNNNHIKTQTETYWRW